MGTLMHAHIESLLNGDVAPLEGLEMQLFRDLLRVDAPKLLAYTVLSGASMRRKNDWRAPSTSWHVQRTEAWYSSIGNVAGI